MIGFWTSRGKYSTSRQVGDRLALPVEDLTHSTNKHTGTYTYIKYSNDSEECMNSCSEVTKILSENSNYKGQKVEGDINIKEGPPCDTRKFQVLQFYPRDFTTYFKFAFKVQKKMLCI
jgi:hypothetical protein